jgi:hypothetical protein
MQPCSSPSIGQLAGALARAQAQLTNPVKNLAVTLETRSGPGAGGKDERSYRYAPLSAGLDIIREALGQQEIAILQTTTFAHESQSSEEQTPGRSTAEGGLLVLTTTLAHSTGEWVSTTWPVCRMGDISDPKLMGAALTYARRYSLFALVGIAGEDDLDASELSRRTTLSGSERGVVPQVSAAEAMPPKHSSRATQSVVRGRGRVAGETRASEPPRPSLTLVGHPRAASNLLVNLEAVHDEAALLRWAKDTLSERAGMNEQDRAALTQAFVERAKAIGASSELPATSGFSSRNVSSERLPMPTPTSVAAGAELGDADAQATI